MDQITIETLDPGLWNYYKQLRLDALKNDPQAFLTTYEEAVSQPDQYWQEKMHDNVFFAKSGDNYVGMIILGLNYRQKLKHIADIFGVYVDPRYRGFGIGQKLLDHVIQKAKSYSIIRKMKLEVVSTQIPAINLYTKNGFHKVGVLKDELHDQNQYFDTLIMEKYL